MPDTPKTTARDRAREAAARLLPHASSVHNVSVIDNALAAERMIERERCAAIAEEQIISCEPEGEVWIVRRILDRIRSGADAG